MFNKLILFSILCIPLLGVTQSVLTNDDGLIHLDPNATLYIEGDVLIENTGVIENSGTIFVQNNWINNSVFNVFLNSNPGTVTLFGNNQSISGSLPTRFYNLNALNAFQKSILTDTWVENKLDITDSEIVLNVNTLHLFNPNPDSLVWNTGFVSGDSIGGYLLRSTNVSRPYWFPVGSSGLLNNYRAVSFIPNSSDSSVIGVRLAHQNADIDFTGTSLTGSTGPFPLAQKDPIALLINPEFYHHIARFHGNTNGTSRLYYFNIDEPTSNDFNGMTVWNNSIPRWSISNFTTNSSPILGSIGFPDKVMTSNSLNFSNDIYALSVQDKLELYVPQIFSPNNDGTNDILFAYGNRFESLTFIIYNRWGEKVFETNDNTVGWNGKFRGIDAQPGVYVYYLEAKILEKGTVTQKGDITLVR